MKDVEPFPLFKGATRVAMLVGVPMWPLMIMFIVVASIAMLFGLLWWLLLLPCWWVMWTIAKHDDKAFRQWGLWFETKGRNRHKAFWGGSTYALNKYRKRK